MQSEHYDAPPVDMSGNPVTDTALVVQGDDRPTIIGYAVVWGSPSMIRPDGYQHVFERGSIVWLPDTLALVEHTLANIVARQSNTTLRLVEDDIGVRVEIDLDGTQLGRDTLARVQSKLVKGMSFGALPWTLKGTIGPERGIKRFTSAAPATACEVSLTAYPAMADTSVTIASESKNLAREMKERSARLSKNRLNQARLAMLRPR